VVEPLYVDRNFLDPEATSEDEVLVRPERVHELLGVQIKTDRLKDIYEGLGFEPAGTEGDALRYKIPTFRPDIEREEDLIEEAARIYGYDEITISSGMLRSYAPPEKEEDTRDRARQLLTGAGYREVLTFPIRDQQASSVPSYWTGGGPVGILNANGQVERTLRRSLVPSFLVGLDAPLEGRKAASGLLSKDWGSQEAPEAQSKSHRASPANGDSLTDGTSLASGAFPISDGQSACEKRRADFRAHSRSVLTGLINTAYSNSLS